MNAGIVTYDDWVTERRDLESCPWAGPRPLSGDKASDVEQLVGRSRDIDSVVDLIRPNDLIRLEAESGVGKTSLLRAGLIPELEANEFKVLYCDTLASGGAESKVDTMLRHAFEGQVELEEGSLADQLHGRFGNTAVLILDQFEELIRYDEGLLAKVSDWVADALQTYELKVVISLRSEYSHRLRDLEDRLNPWVEIGAMRLRPVSAREHVRELLRVPLKGDLSTSILSEEAEGRILELWEKHRLGSQATGLLQLHSLLYALHGRCDPGPKITEETIAELMPPEDGMTVFDVAMAETVQLKMDLCQDALGGDAADPYLRYGTRRLVQRAVKHLSSGGYKVIQEQYDLLLHTIEDELATLDPDRRWAGSAQTMSLLEQAFRALMRSVDDGPDLLTAPWHDFAAAQLEDVQFHGQPWDLDPGDGRTSGAMLGLDPSLVALEEARRFAFALKWLEESHLVRMTDTGKGQTMVSLVHDGFGRALESWSDSVVVGPVEEIYRLTAAKGEVFDWSRDEAEPWSGIDGARIVNARWQHCEIEGAWFRHVTFVNCDLRGTRFVDCQFEGVAFLNCLLDGVTVTDSRIVGEVPPYAEWYPKGVPPSFEVDCSDDPRALERLVRYRGARIWSGDIKHLISHTSGMPAVPASSAHEKLFVAAPVDGKPAKVASSPPSGGFAMYGGRLCSLMIRRCTFPDNGELGLRLVSGTALDVVECSEERVAIDIYGSKIRGMTITGGVEKSSEGPLNLKLEVVDAVLAETWIGSQIGGSLEADNTVLWQMVNLSNDLEATFNKCPAFGMVNVGASEGLISLDDGFRSDILADPAAAMAIVAPMDYQSDPALGEYERRMRETPELVWPHLGTYAEDERL